MQQGHDTGDWIAQHGQSRRECSTLPETEQELVQALLTLQSKTLSVKSHTRTREVSEKGVPPRPQKATKYSLNGVSRSHLAASPPHTRSPYLAVERR